MKRNIVINVMNQVEMRFYNQRFYNQLVLDKVLDKVDDQVVDHLYWQIENQVRDHLYWQIIKNQVSYKKVSFLQQ